MTTLVRFLAGSGWPDLPRPCQSVHRRYNRFEGQIDVTLSPNPVLRAATRLAGIPPPQTAAPLILTTEAKNGVEVWTRQIGAQTLVSKRWIEKENLLAERMGPVTVLSKIRTTRTGTDQVALSWRFLGVPMPRALMPVIHAEDRAEAGTYHFDILVSLPWFRVILFGYSGHLKID